MANLMLGLLVAPPLVKKEEGVALTELLVDVLLEDILQLGVHDLHHGVHDRLQQVLAALLSRLTSILFQGQSIYKMA